MIETKEILSKRALIIIGIVSLIIFFIGVILIILGYNEAFYIENSLVQIVFGIITYSGNAFFLIIFIAIFSFTYDKRYANNFFFIYILSGYINTLIKEIVQDPRPSTNISKSAQRGYASSGYGFPSGHAQVAVTNWGFTAYYFKDNLKPYIIPIICSIFIFLVAISRLIIGVHDLQDIIGGLLIGIGILILFIDLKPIASEKINVLSFSIKLILAIIVPVLLFVLGTLFLPESEYGINIYAVSGGSLLGLLLGQVLEDKYIKYEPSELNLRQKIINLIIGLGLLMIYLIFIYGIIIGTDIHEFIRNAIVSLIITLIMPFIFTKINRK
ncbi:MAG: phosphatase PAP2 family protein [Promethearchaeota archaeon]|nr:MAG: phosphatase PAP2 family protein [Candidatus Lokiarchaeota archaeon]